MNELINTRTPEVIAAEIRTLTATMLSNVIEIGRRMAEAKAILPHGEFGPWLEKNTAYSQRTANNFMKLYDAYGDQQASLFGANSNSQTFANLPYSKALALLSVPENEREAFAEEVRADEISLRELKDQIAKREEERDRAVEDLAAVKEDLREMSEQLDDAQTTIDRQADELDELKNRPVEVAVREPSPEELDAIVADRMQEITSMHALEHAEMLAALEQERQKLKDLKDQLKVAQTEQKKAVEAAKSEGKKALEAERAKAAQEAKEKARKLAEDKAAAEQKVRDLTAQLENARKQMALADEAAIAFKAAFGQWQRAHADMEAALERAAPETAKKLRAAMAAQMDAWRKEA